MWQSLQLVLDFLFTCWDQIIVLYFAGGILSAVFVVFILRKISKLIKRFG